MKKDMPKLPPRRPPSHSVTRKWARFDLPVIRPSTSRKRIARRLV